MAKLPNKALKRLLDLNLHLKKKSFFLFGPRSTGKSTLIRETLPQALLIDLLNAQVFLRLSENRGALEEFHAKGKFSKGEIIVIDEVQKIPDLLDEVHRLIEARQCHFLLTGSSARKLKHGQVNLLAGRAWRMDMFPLTYAEIPEFNLDRVLRYGGLPQVVLSDDPDEELNAYVNTYLKEEIQAECLVRKFPSFVRFLKVAALSNAQLIHYQNIASDCSVPANTVRDYFEILSDTLIGFRLEPWGESKKRKAISTAKFYFFDTGVYHTLIGTKDLSRNSNVYGISFEQWIAMELRAYLSYRRIREELAFWRTDGGFEVDFTVGDRVAIEVKCSNKTSDRDIKGLKALQEENRFEKMFLVSHEKISRTKEGIHFIHYSDFLEKLWDDKII